MTLEDFLAAKRVLEDGYPVRTQSEIEDAEHKLRPVRIGYWRLFVVSLVVFFAALIAAGFLAPDLPDFASIFITFGASWLAMHLPVVRDRFIPVRQAKLTDIIWVARR
jgi:hypothetical protein